MTASEKVARRLLSLLPDDHPSVRVAVVYALGQVGINIGEVREALVGALTDPADPVRYAAAVAFVRIGITTVPIVSVLIEALRSDDTDVKVEAREALAAVSKSTLSQLGRPELEQIVELLHQAVADMHREVAGPEYDYIAYDGVWNALWMMCQALETS